MDTEHGTYSARYLAVATSASSGPVVPDIPGTATFQGTCNHSRSYRNAGPFRGRRVLLVGNGNSAAEIALDLVEGGAAHVGIWSRGPRHFIPLIRSGAIRIIDGNVRPIRALTAGGVRFGDGEEPFDAVILATGFRASLDFLDEPERLLARDDDRGQVLPITDGQCRSVVEPTLFLPGFDLSAIGGFSLGRWGWEIGRTLARVA